ncbi:NADP-dependent 3-hydroxy acid dehydrogenase YdfG [Paraburkholderia fungorum]|uniref:SDR family oxidoreductase n=1 Tax=Paraburkholderia fungorum TaxID=134537 RepID=UPI000D06BB67|nr:SDR family oxidoreductase [Paraburkholderia fungorum]PRZ44973.1 NADP-dependent 3-hydroxy acid dehydrogenase YdfG [Paraburkholderia fungorum]
MASNPGKVVVVTGGSSGIGEATARELASRGATVVIGALGNTVNAMKRIVEDIQGAGGKAAYYEVDVTKREDVEGLVKFAHERFGRVDVMVNNAGIMPLSPIDALKVEEWDRMIDINIKGVLYGIAAVLPGMKSRRSGHIINIASVAGHIVTKGSAVYCGTKFAVRAISEGLRQEVGDDIRVTIISPGAVESHLADSITDENSKAEEAKVRAIAIGARYIAGAIAFAMEQPPEVDVNEILIRPTAQPF